MSQIPLSRAYICLDCDTIGDDAEHCTCCPSTTVHPVAAFLNRDSKNPSHTCADRPTLPCVACGVKP